MSITQDIRYALRILSKSPGFALMAILTLALGIGANTAIFSVINTVLLRPLPYQDPSRLMFLCERPSGTDIESVNYLNFRDWEAQQKSFSSMAAFKNSYSVNLVDSTGPSQLSTRLVTSDFFSTLGVSPALGRDFRRRSDGGVALRISSKWRP